MDDFDLKTNGIFVLFSAEGKKKEGEKLPQSAPKLSANELERVTEVFKMYETGLREATIYPKVSSLLFYFLGRRDE